MDTYKKLAKATKKLSESCDSLQFTGVDGAVAHVYNPLAYAQVAHDMYLKKYGSKQRRVIFMGMNPGPYGMMQVGVPFGEVNFVRDWLGIVDGVVPPKSQHPKRPIEGFDCQRSEVSGKRFWGWAQQRWLTADAFFDDCFVLNYCPLIFLEASGKNLTPDKLTAAERAALETICDEHLREAIETLQPEWCIGIGAFAKKRLDVALSHASIDPNSKPKIAQILHPSPQSPLANRGWAQAVELTLADLGVFA
jgi:single-strand selective monofunctional uracil DNA glycosylase